MPAVEALSSKRLSALLEALYGGLSQAEPWAPFLRLLAETTDATYATLILAGDRDRINSIVTPDADPRQTGRYADGVFASDPFVGLPEGEVVSYRDFVDERMIDPSFRAFMESGRTSQVLGVDLRVPSGAEARLRITRDESRPEFDAAGRAILAALVPHLRIALGLFARFEQTTVEQAVYRSAVERLAVATFILDAHGMVLRKNAVADRLVSAGKGLSLHLGRLAFSARKPSTVLSHLLASPPAPGEDQRFRIEDTGEHEMWALARTVPAQTFPAESGAVLALFVVDPSQSAAANADALRDLFQLTPMEATLTATLARGAALVDAARTLGMAHNTARSHLRAIFAKTGVRRQSELVHLIQTSLAGFDAPESA